MSAPAPAVSFAPRVGTPCTILVNNKAGALHATAGVEQVREMASAIGLEADVIGTESPEETRAVLKKLVAAGAERVAVSGGDGTVALAVQELAHAQTALGIIPQGTANNCLLYTSPSPRDS